MNSPMRIAVRAMLMSGSSRMIGLPIAAVCSIVSVREILKYAGPVDFGFVVLAGGLFQMLPFADLGLGAPIINAVARAGDSESARLRAMQTVDFARRALWCSATSIIILSCGVALCGGWSLALSLPRPDTPWANWAIPLALVPFAISLRYAISQRVLVGLGRSHVVSACNVLSPLVGMCTLLGLIAMRVDPYVLAVSTPVGLLASALLSSHCAARASANLFYRTCPKSRTGALLTRDVWRGALPMLLVASAFPVVMQSARLIVGRELSADDLAEFTLAATFYTPGYAVISAAALSLWPIFTRSSVRTLHLWRNLVVVMAVGGCALGVIYFAAVPYVSRVVSNGLIEVPTGLSISFGVLLFIMAIHQPSGMLLTSPRALSFQARCCILALLLGPLLGIVIVRLMGPAGPVWAVVASMAICCVFPAIWRALAVFRAGSTRLGKDNSNGY
jgi:O-antigen/teichoic acid export membrane protein